MTKQDQDQMNEPKLTNYVRVPMEPLYEKLLKKPYPDSVSAIEYCRSVCAEFGFTVKQEASANRNIYVYCSREGLPDSQRNPKPSPQRKRPSKRCDCRWRVVLSENEHEEWEFRKSMNPNASEHNHDMMSPEEMVKAWPAEVNKMIIQLARQRLQTHEIREAVKQHFPDITWNERRFYNRLTEERKRIRQRGVVERSKRLLLLSARLCSVVASNDDWTTNVENEIQRMFENFCQLARLSPKNIDNLVDLQPDMIQMDTDRLASSTHRLSIGTTESEDESNNMGSPAKKRRSFASGSTATAATSSPANDSFVAHRSIASSTTNNSEAQKGIQVVYVPSYMIQIRTSMNRSSPESPNSSTTGRHIYSESPFLENQQAVNNVAATSSQLQQQQQQAFGSSSSFFSLASPTSSSSSASSIPFQRHAMTAPQQTRGITSPQQSMTSPNEFIMSHPSYQTPQPQQQNVNTNISGGTTTATSSTAAGGMAYAIQQTSFSPYNAFTSPPELPFAFEPNMMNVTTSSQQQQQQQQRERSSQHVNNRDNSHNSSGSHNNATVVIEGSHRRRHHNQQVYGFFPNNDNNAANVIVKEEASNDQALLQQQHSSNQQQQQQQQEYDQRMHRNFSQQGYALPPMIRSNEDPDEAHWP